MPLIQLHDFQAQFGCINPSSGKTFARCMYVFTAKLDGSSLAQAIQFAPGPPAGLVAKPQTPPISIISIISLLLVAQIIEIIEILWFGGPKPPNRRISIEMGPISIISIIAILGWPK